ncbi:MAG: hypothetical protein WCL00_04335 [Bacteroidota bacterium]
MEVRRVVTLLIVICVCLIISSCAGIGERYCLNYFRWDVKTMTDSSAARLFPLISMNSSIEDLIKLTPPVRLSSLSKNDGKLPRFESEKQLVRIKCEITNMELEKDQDFHIVVKSLTSKATMIVEVPCLFCPVFDLHPEQRAQLSAARSQAIFLYNIFKSNKRPIKVEITGALFWDAPHFWIKRSSKTGIEIHPVTEIRILEK